MADDETTVTVSVPENEPPADDGPDVVVVESGSSDHGSIPVELATWMAEERAARERLENTVTEALGTAYSAQATADVAEANTHDLVETVSEAVAEVAEVAEELTEQPSADDDIPPQKEHWLFR